MRIGINLDSSIAKKMLFYAKNKDTSRKKLIEEIILSWRKQNKKDIDQKISDVLIDSK